MNAVEDAYTVSIQREEEILEDLRMTQHEHEPGSEAWGALLKELRERHGRQVDSNFVDVLLALLENGDVEPDRIPQVDDENLLRSARAKFTAERYRVAERRLEVAVYANIAKRCVAVRNGGDGS